MACHVRLGGMFRGGHDRPCPYKMQKIPDALQMPSIRSLLPLFRELNDLKRIRVAARAGSLAEQMFHRAWARLVSGEPLEEVAAGETARAVVAARLAGVDAQVLSEAGLPEEERKQIFERAFDSVASALESEFAADLKTALDTRQDFLFEPSEVPEFARLLANQPRAGATRPGFARVVLEPAENHAQHCAVVAVNSYLASSVYGARPERAFLTGLCHHFHNAYLPDAGDAGDHLLEQHLAPMMETFRTRALSQLPSHLASEARASLDAVYRSDTPESKAFQAGDSIDRVLEMEWHARSNEFTLSVALDQMDIIHPGPVQAFQLDLMRELGFK